jgi:tRNA(Ile)-lysidine synthase
MTPQSRYPKPGPVGGALCRSVVAAFRQPELILGDQDHLLIAISGGSDSLALGHLLLRYGRRVAPVSRIGILHLSHQWRPKKTATEADFVKKFATHYGVRFHHEVLDPPEKNCKNLEEDARGKRQAIYRKFAGVGRPYRYVCTAHHRNDVAETNLWRILRGQWGSHSEGIRASHQGEIRPLLRLRKEQLLAFCAEEKLKYLKDSTNLDVRFFRGRIRKQIFPLLAKTGFDPIEGFARLSDS